MGPLYYYVYLENPSILLSFVGGHPEMKGFVGCIRSLYIQFDSADAREIGCARSSEDVKESSNPTLQCQGVEIDTCGMEDR